MNRILLAPATLLVAGAIATTGQLASGAAAQELTSSAVNAANRYLELLEPGQSAKTAFEFESPSKPKWHNGPPTMNVGPGTTFGELSPAQLKAAYELIQAVLSPYGYQKVLNIMAADEEFGRDGANFPTGPKAYSVAVYGTPSRTQPWEVQVNGHHLGLNVTIVGRENILSPSLTGAFPSTFEKEGKTVRVMSDETDAAFSLMEMLDSA